MSSTGGNMRTKFLMSVVMLTLSGCAVQTDPLTGPKGDASAPGATGAKGPIGNTGPTGPPGGCLGDSISPLETVGHGDDRGIDDHALAESPESRVHVAELRQRFRWAAREHGPVDSQRLRPARSPATPMAVIGPSAVDAFERASGGRVRAVVNEHAHRAANKPARVELPARASEAVYIEDETSGMAIEFELEGALDAEVALGDGMAVYKDALPDGASIVHRVGAEGTEDYLVFERKPTREELSYRVDVSRVAGLRLVSNTLEFLDAEGVPRLRVAPPYVVDAGGVRHEANVGIDKCLYDANPRPSWKRSVAAPGATRCAVRLAWRNVVYPTIVDPAWVTTGDMITPRFAHTATVLSDGTVLVAGGEDTNGQFKSAELYNPSTEIWSSTSSMSVFHVFHTASILASGKVLIAGGGSSIAELFDFSTHTWASAGNMSVSRNAHTASVLSNGKVFVTGGLGGAASLSSAELYDPSSNSWSPRTGMGLGRSFHTASVLPTNEVLVAGGSVTANNDSASAELYNVSSNSWSITENMMTAREGHTECALLNGKILVAGGNNNGIGVTGAELYDSSTHTWTSAGNMAKARSDNTASRLATGRVLVVGGFSLPSAELYDPSTNAWIPAANTAIEHFSHTASVLLSGKVLISGGNTPNGAIANAELYTALLNGTPCMQSGECMSGNCVDGVCCNTACNTGVCDACSIAAGAPSNGTCALLTGNACNDGNLCTQTDVCQSGVCIGAAPIVCAALDQCHIAGSCSPATGLCSNPSKSNGATCDDSNACTQSDTCQLDVCVGASPIICTALDLCHDPGVCNPGTGVCSNPTKANGTECDDGKACTQSDVCQSGVCMGTTPVVCSALDSCHDSGNCDPATGVCSNPAKADGIGCDDGNACTQSDICQSGICTGTTSIVCKALDLCHDPGVCDKNNGQCSNPEKLNGATCGNGICRSGACMHESGNLASSEPDRNLYSCSASRSSSFFSPHLFIPLAALVLRRRSRRK